MSSDRAIPHLPLVAALQPPPRGAGQAPLGDALRRDFPELQESGLGFRVHSCGIIKTAVLTSYSLSRLSLAAFSGMHTHMFKVWGHLRFDVSGL